MNFIKKLVKGTEGKIQNSEESTLNLQSNEQQSAQSISESAEGFESFKDLPLDLAVHIFEWTNVSELSRIRRVCKYWKQIADHDKLWKRHYLHHFGAPILWDDSSTAPDTPLKASQERLSLSSSGNTRLNFIEHWRELYISQIQNVRLDPKACASCISISEDCLIATHNPASCYGLVLSQYGFHDGIHKMTVKFEASNQPYCAVGVVPKSTSYERGEHSMTTPNGCSLAMHTFDVIVGGVAVSNTFRDPPYIKNGSLVTVVAKLSSEKQICKVQFYVNNEKVEPEVNLQYKPPFHFALCLWASSKFTVMLDTLN